MLLLWVSCAREKNKGRFVISTKKMWEKNECGKIDLSFFLNYLDQSHFNNWWIYWLMNGIKNNVLISTPHSNWQCRKRKKMMIQLLVRWSLLSKLKCDVCKCFILVDLVYFHEDYIHLMRGWISEYVDNLKFKKVSKRLQLTAAHSQFFPPPLQPLVSFLKNPFSFFPWFISTGVNYTWILTSLSLTFITDHNIYRLIWESISCHLIVSSVLSSNVNILVCVNDCYVC